MKKKIFLCFAAILAILGIFAVQKTTTTTHAVDLPEAIEVKVSNFSNNRIRLTIDNDNTTQYHVTWAEIFRSLDSLLSEERALRFYFENFDVSQTAEKYISLSGDKQIILSGQVISRESSEIFAIKSDSQAAVFLDGLNVTSDTCNFVIFNESTSSQITIGENVSYSGSVKPGTPYLINYERGSEIIIDEKCSCQIKVFVDYWDLYQEKIITCPSSVSALADFYYPSADTFTATALYSSYDGGIIANSSIKYTFNLNGGRYSSVFAGDYQINDSGEYVITYPYTLNVITSVEFEDQGRLEKRYSTLAGWFGKCDISGTTYYFDSEMLRRYYEGGGSLANVPRYFTQDISRLNDSYKIKGYSNLNKNDYSYYKHIEFFLNNGLVPTYVAKWENESFSITFVTNCDTPLDPIMVEYGTTIPQLGSELAVTGYKLEGWYLNDNFTTKFTQTIMPAENLTLYARWVKDNFTIHFHEADDLEDLSIEYEAEITLPEPAERNGYNFAGWFTDSGYETPFEETIMPAHDIDLYAKWEEYTYSITLYLLAAPGTSSLFGITYEEDTFTYGSPIPAKEELTLPDHLGYDIGNYYSDANFTLPFDFNSTITSNIYIYIQLIPLEYKIDFVNNKSEEKFNSIAAHYKEDITLPVPAKITGWRFDGWYEDENFSRQFTATRMPASNYTLYAKWTEKSVYEIEYKTQSYKKGENFSLYSVLDYTGITIYYLVDGEWTKDVPTKVGTYDIKITREEDDNYAALEVTFERGLKILETATNIAWIIAFLYIAAVLEFLTCILLKMMRKKKMSATFVFIGPYLIVTKQFVNLLFSGALFLVGFVYMVYNLVALTRTVNNENFAPSKEDSRERFKDELKFQNDQKNSDPEFTTETKTDESFGKKYSEEDIKRMLVDDNYSQKIRQTYGGAGDEANNDYEESNRRLSMYSTSDSDEENIMPDMHYRLQNKTDEDNYSSNNNLDSNNDFDDEDNDMVNDYDDSDSDFDDEDNIGRNSDDEDGYDDTSASDDDPDNM